MSCEFLPCFPKNSQIAGEIVNLVDKILEFKKQGKDTSEFESQIDTAAYALTADEIALIENKENKEKQITARGKTRMVK